MVIPKPIQWTDINFLEDQILEGNVQPESQNFVPPKPNTQLRHVQQYHDGKVRISFDRSKPSTGSRYSDVSFVDSIDVGRVSRIPFIINIPYKTNNQNLQTNLPQVINLPYETPASIPTWIYLLLPFKRQIMVPPYLIQSTENLKMKSKPVTSGFSHCLGYNKKYSP